MVLDLSWSSPPEVVELSRVLVAYAEAVVVEEGRGKSREASAVSPPEGCCCPLGQPPVLPPPLLSALLTTTTALRYYELTKAGIHSHVRPDQASPPSSSSSSLLPDLINARPDSRRSFLSARIDSSFLYALKSRSASTRIRSPTPTHLVLSSRAFETSPSFATPSSTRNLSSSLSNSPTSLPTNSSTDVILVLLQERDELEPVLEIQRRMVVRSAPHHRRQLADGVDDLLVPVDEAVELSSGLSKVDGERLGCGRVERELSADGLETVDEGSVGRSCNGLDELRGSKFFSAAEGND